MQKEFAEREAQQNIEIADLAIQPKVHHNMVVEDSSHQTSMQELRDFLDCEQLLKPSEELLKTEPDVNENAQSTSRPPSSNIGAPKHLLIKV